MEKIILHLDVNENRPEEMRVIFKDSWYLVQINNGGKWITQKEHKTDKNAVMDCVTWY